MEDNKILPIGSVILLKGGKHRLMIMGYSPLRKEKTTKLYDYWACFYPEGLLLLDKTIVFNKEDILEVINVGYSDNEEKEFRAKINKILNEIKDENGNLKYNDVELSNYIMSVVKGGIK